MDTPHAPDFLSTRKYPYVGDDSYQQLLRNAISRIDAIMTRQLDRCDELCCELPKPDFIEVSRNPDSRTEKKSLLIRPAAKEQKLYEQVGLPRALQTRAPGCSLHAVHDDILCQQKMLCSDHYGHYDSVATSAIHM